METEIFLRLRNKIDSKTDEKTLEKKSIDENSYCYQHCICKEEDMGFINQFGLLYYKYYFRIIDYIKWFCNIVMFGLFSEIFVLGCDFPLWVQIFWLICLGVVDTLALILAVLVFIVEYRYQPPGLWRYIIKEEYPDMTDEEIASREW